MLNAVQQGWQQPRWINRLLYPLSLFYIGVLQVRRQCYQFGIFKRHKLPRPVIVVGNLSVGGVGKTPLLIALVEHLKTRGRKPGVISRGYRANSKSWPREVTQQDTPDEVGDEPVLIFQRCQVPVVVGPNRAENAQLLIDNHDCDVLLSDDGFQHFALHRDIDIVVLDGRSRFGNGWCLPAGPLREPSSALKRATFVVINQQPQPERQNKNGNSSSENEFAMNTYIDQAVCFSTNSKTRTLSEFAGETVHAIAGIGNPERFFRQLRANGINVIPHAHPDHHAFTQVDFELAAAGHDQAVLMTEKDAVKFDALITSGVSFSRPLTQYWKVPLRVDLAPELMNALYAHI